MISFEVQDMTCGHCVSTITKALKAADRDAKVQIDLGQHLVQIEPGDLEAHELADAIKEAGYTPMPAAVGSAAPASGGCCGCR
ncbi:MAG: heavy-metal-associated domain-containing protein [Rhizobacter sp.]|nr:heavy-metal-associated domain-containing protein [Rhizobacter sp.]